MKYLVEKERERKSSKRETQNWIKEWREEGNKKGEALYLYRTEREGKREEVFGCASEKGREGNFELG